MRAEAARKEKRARRGIVAKLTVVKTHKTDLDRLAED